MKRSPLGVGAKSTARGSTFAAKPKPLATRKRLKARKPLRQVNPERKARKAELAWGPGGTGGVYAMLIRARSCDTCGEGRRLPKAAMRKEEGGWTVDLDRLDKAAQSDPSHVQTRGAGGRWWHLVSQCRECHAAVHAQGWGSCRGLAELLAASLAWSATDQGLIAAGFEPQCDRPGLPRWAEDGGEVEHYRGLLRAAWPGRHEVEPGPVV